MARGSIMTGNGVEEDCWKLQTNFILSSSKFGWLTSQQVILSVAKDLDPGAPGRRFFATLSSDNAGSQ